MRWPVLAFAQPFGDLRMMRSGLILLSENQIFSKTKEFINKGGQKIFQFIYVYAKNASRLALG
jgi:hypothetical protein